MGHIYVDNTKYKVIDNCSYYLSSLPFVGQMRIVNGSVFCIVKLQQHICSILVCFYLLLEKCNQTLVSNVKSTKMDAFINTQMDGLI